MRDTSDKKAGRPRFGLVGSCIVLLAIALCWRPRTARAEPELTLHWSTPRAAQCPDQAWAEARVAAQLGRTPSANVARGVRAEVAISTHADGFALALQTTFQGQSGTRTLEGARCDQLSEAATLIISLSVSQASEQIAAAPTLAPAQGAQPPTQTRTPPQPEPAPPGPALGLFARAEAVLQVGLWNRVAVGPGLAVGLERGPFRAELAGFWFPPLTLQVQGREFEASLGAARALGCLIFGQARVRGGGCAGIEFGGARSRTPEAGPETGRDAHNWWSAASLGGRLHVRLIARLSLVAAAEMLVGLTRLRFSSEDKATQMAEALYDSKPVQLRASLGPELRF